MPMILTLILMISWSVVHFIYCPPNSFGEISGCILQRFVDDCSIHRSAINEKRGRWDVLDQTLKSATESRLLYLRLHELARPNVVMFRGYTKDP